MKPSAQIVVIVIKVAISTDKMAKICTMLQRDDRSLEETTKMLLQSWAAGRIKDVKGIPSFARTHGTRKPARLDP